MGTMPGNRIYLRGIGFSVLIHLGLLLMAFLLWIRPAPEPEPEKVLWDVDMFQAEESPVTELATPEPAPQQSENAEPPMEPLDQPAAMPGADLESLGSPAFGAPSIEAPGSVSAGTTAMPSTSINGTNLSGPWGGQGNGSSALGIPSAMGAGGGLIPTLRVPPVYPIEARKKKLEGWVKVDFNVTEDGSVTDVKVRDASPTGIFEQAAVAAIAQWKFRPYLEEGKPRRQRAAQTLRFDLQN